MNPTVIIVLAAGATVGAGVYLIVRELTPGVPALGPALRGLHAPTAQPAQTAQPIHGPLAAVAGRLRIPQRELALIGYTTERYVTEKVLFTMVGLLFPPLFGLLLTLTPIHVGILISSAVGVGLAGLFFWLVDVSIHQQATEARKVFTRHVGVYFNLVAQQLIKSKGPTEALETAAAVGGGWVCARIRASLEASRLRLEPPWDGLRTVAADIGVPDLGEIGEIMTLAGTEGAPVYQTLRSRANAMHATWIATEKERANKATTVLYIPTSLLVLVLFVVGAYPLLIRLVST
jgi:hypothetical protein